MIGTGTIASGRGRRCRRAAMALGALGIAFGLGMSAGAAADHIKIGVVRSQGGASAFVAKAKGYFKEEGLDAELVMFTAAAPIAVAGASGDIDFGSTGMTAAFCNLANAGTLRIIGSGSWEHPGFETIGFLVSNQAHAAGLHSLKELKGHSVGITQLGTPLHYDLARVLKKHGIPLGSVKVLPLQSNPNVASALKGGQVDAAVQTTSNVYSLVAKGDAKVLGWMADEFGSGQSAVTFTTGKMAKDHPDIVRRFLKAFRKGGATWDAGFTDAQGNRKDQPSAPEMVGIVAQELHEPPEVIKRGIGYFDPDDRLVLSDIQDALDWYQEQGMLKTHIDAASVVDARFALFAK